MRALLISMILPMIAATAMRCSATTAAAGSDETMKSSGPWVVSIETEGGISGKGLGAARIDSAGEVTASDLTHKCQGQTSAEESSRLGSLIDKSAAVRWEPSYTDPSSPHGEFDQIRYTLTVKSGDSAERKTYWFDRSGDRLPAQIRALYDEVWTVHNRVVASCR